MSGMHFLVCLREGNTSEKILMFIHQKEKIQKMVAKVKGEISNLSTELLEIEISDDTVEVVLMIAVILQKS